MSSAFEVLTIVVVGVMVGVEFFVVFVMKPILDALPGDAGQLGHAHGGRMLGALMLGALMPFWYIGSLALSVVWAVAGRHDQGTGLVVTAAALLILSVIMSFLLLVPINNRNKTWTPENRPADWKEQLNRWERWHYARIAVITGAFALLVAALT